MPDLYLHSKKPGVAVISSANPLDNMEIYRISRSEWKDTPNKPGVYLLYGSPDGQLTAYIGMSTSSMKKRIASHHVDKKKNWFGVLFAIPLPLATICPAVEAELIYMIREAGVVDIVDNRSNEKRMHGLEDYQVDHTVDALVGALELILGQDIFTAQEQEKITLGPRLSRSISKTTIKDLLDYGLLQKGEEIVFTRNNINAKANIDKTGKILINSEAFATPSAAASRVYGAKSGINGWRDWKTVSGKSLLDLREQFDNRNQSLETRAEESGAPSIDNSAQRASNNKSKGQEAKPSSASLRDLLDANLIDPEEILYCMWSNRSDKKETAKVLSDGLIQTEDGEKFTSPSGAAAHLRGGAANGWDFWGVEISPGNKITLAELRKKLY